jgi:hypothetical protein
MFEDFVKKLEGVANYESISTSDTALMVGRKVKG